MQAAPVVNLQLLQPDKDRADQFTRPRLQKYHQSNWIPFSLLQQYPLHLQATQEQGASLSGWDMRYDTLMPIAENSVKWMKDELGYEINEKREFKKLAHNIEVIGDLRRTELKRLKNKEGPAEEMLLTKKMCKELML
jgi:hypothetical protein